jgi:FkbM family methyltransferase
MKKMEVKENLIFDIGLHKGEDTAYYMKEGYNVLAVEANPVLVKYCEEKFKNEIKSNRLTIVNAGIAEETGIMPFYVNLHSSEWSSFDKSIGTRNNTKFEIINVPCVTTKTLFEKYGIPYYMKVDIEGNDFLSLKDIPDSDKKPAYVSCEANDAGWLDILNSKGYKRFKLINQANNFTPLNLEREKSNYYLLYRKIKHAIKHKLRNVIKSKYRGGSSGPFGEKTKGDWKTYEEVRKIYIDYYQGDLKTPVNNISWFDFHAAL